ncbi:glycosyltransferase family 2 protein [Haliea sp. E17]|uniref:glycosyltransferase family 2 protein n=1 Tax=Haliea sp. E17 TaxID=3401576 RepID=UPI003AAC2726
MPTHPLKLKLQARAQSLRHSMAFVLSRRIDLSGFLPGGPVQVESHHDCLEFDVSGVRRGLYFLSLKYRSAPALMGPRVRRVTPGGESDAEVFLFENAAADEVFGTVLLDADTDSLRFYPSRLASAVDVERVTIRPITEFARKRIYGVPYVRFKVFGAGWFFRDIAGQLLRGIKTLWRRPTSRGYADWWEIHGRCSDAELQQQRESAPRFALQPLVSIVLPTFRPDMKLFTRAVESVRGQSYGNWQLCICDDASDSQVLSDYLAQLAASDPRIDCVTRAQNGHISAASNTALALARGEFVGFLDHDDSLAPNALYEYVEALNRAPATTLLYSDEDVVDQDGRPLNGHFKPDWNFDLLRAINYVCHFLVVKRDLLQAVGGLREGFEGAQDHDLLLRLAEHCSREHIVHIPRVLYHWCAAEGSTAQTTENKPYAAQAGLRALAGHIERLQLAADAEPSEISTAYRVHYRLPDPPPSVSIIIPTRNDLRVLGNCLRSLREVTAYSRFEVVVVDNNSDDPQTLGFLQSEETAGRLRVLRYPGAFNFSALNNFAVAQCDSDVVVMLNNDTEVLNPDWLAELVSQAMRPGVGAVGAKLLFANDRIQHAGVVLGLGGDGIAGHAFKGRHRNEVGSLARTRLVQEYNAVTGACLAVRRERYLEVGGLDEANLAVAYNDVDFCLRLRERGYVNLWTPYAQLYHFQSYSRGVDSSEQNIQRYTREAQYMRRRWGQRLVADEYYNPNLSRGLRSFELDWPQ